jgi:hypothetical protein
LAVSRRNGCSWRKDIFQIDAKQTIGCRAVDRLSNKRHGQISASRNGVDAPRASRLVESGSLYGRVFHSRTVKHSAIAASVTMVFPTSAVSRRSNPFYRYDPANVFSADSVYRPARQSRSMRRYPSAGNCLQLRCLDQGPQHPQDCPVAWRCESDFNLRQRQVRVGLCQSSGPSTEAPHPRRKRFSGG